MSTMTWRHISRGKVNAGIINTKNRSKLFDISLFTPSLTLQIAPLLLLNSHIRIMNISFSARQQVGFCLTSTHFSWLNTIIKNICFKVVKKMPFHSIFTLLFIATSNAECDVRFNYEFAFMVGRHASEAHWGKANEAKVLISRAPFCPK